MNSLSKTLFSSVGVGVLKPTATGVVGVLNPTAVPVVIVFITGGGAKLPRFNPPTFGYASDSFEDRQTSNLTFVNFLLEWKENFIF